MAARSRRGRSTISVLQETRDSLDSIKHRGQTYDGVIHELIEAWRREHAEETAQRPLDTGAAKERG